MAIPTWSVGEVLSAADVNAWFVPVVRQKPSDETVTSSTTLQNDNDLVLPVAANAAYTLEGELAATGGTLNAGDIKLGFTVPSGTTFRITTVGYDLQVSVTPLISQARASGPWSHGVNGGAASPVLIRGHVTTSSTAGSLTLQWAQNTSNGTATTVLTGSWMMLRRIG